MTVDVETPAGTELELRSAYLPAMRVEDARAAMSAYQELCAAVLEPADWIGTPGEPESFVKRSGWDKMATFYGASVELLGDTILERNADGDLIRAAARARATGRDGRFREAGGACGRNEPRFVAARGRQKIEHDLPATAETRAVNRAIASLVGFGAVSAEEVDGDVRAGRGGDLPPWAHDVPDEAVDRLGAGLDAILEAAGVDDHEATAADVARKLTAYCDGVFPIACARLVRLLARAIPALAAPTVVDAEMDDALAGASDTPPAEADVVDDDEGIDHDAAAGGPDIPPETTA